MDTAEKRIARAEELHAATPEQWIVDVFGRVISGDGNVVAVCPEPHLRKSSEAWPVNRRFIAESRALLPALAADAKRAVRYERNLCSIAKILTDAGVPLTAETVDGPTIDRIHERVAHLVDAAKRLLEERKRASEEQDHLMETVAAIRRALKPDMVLDAPFSTEVVARNVTERCRVLQETIREANGFLNDLGYDGALVRATAALADESRRGAKRASRLSADVAALRVEKTVLVETLDLLAKGASTVPCMRVDMRTGQRCGEPRKCLACEPLAVLEWWHLRSSALQAERDRAMERAEKAEVTVQTICAHLRLVSPCELCCGRGHENARLCVHCGGKGWNLNAAPRADLLERLSKAERERDQAREAFSQGPSSIVLGDQRIAAALDLLRQYQAACARWTESQDPRDEAEVVRLRGQIAIVSLPKGGE